MLLSIVIPVYNEVRTLEAIIERILAVDAGMDRQIILVDDGSKDGTRELYPKIQSRWPKQRFDIKLQEENQGKGAAIREGFRLAEGDIVLIQDADLEYDPGDYPALLAPILEEKADVVFGSRFVGGQAHRVLYFWHSVANRMLTLFSNMMTNLNLTDMESCYKVFRKEVVKSFELKSKRFTMEPEITAKVARGRWRIYEVGISYSGRTYAEGKKVGLRDAFTAVVAIVRFRLFD